MKINESMELYLNYCRQIYLSPKTLQLYVHVFGRFKNYLKNQGFDLDVDSIESVEKNVIRSYLVQEQASYSTATVRTRRAVLSSFYSWLVQDCEVLENNPVMSIRLRVRHEDKKQTVITKEEIAKIYEYFNSIPYNKRGYTYYIRRLVISLLCGTGVRVGSLVNLKYSHYDEENCCIKFIGKGDKDLSVYFSEGEIPEYIRIIHDYTNSDYIVAHANGKPYLPAGINNIVKDVCRFAGIEKPLTAHAFRRGYATYMIENGVDLSVVKDCLGHSDIQTTMRYVRLSEKTISDTMKKFSPLDVI